MKSGENHSENVLLTKQTIFLMIFSRCVMEFLIPFLVLFLLFFQIVQSLFPQTFPLGQPFLQPNTCNAISYDFRRVHGLKKFTPQWREVVWLHFIAPTQPLVQDFILTLICIDFIGWKITGSICIITSVFELLQISYNFSIIDRHKTS